MDPVTPERMQQVVLEGDAAGARLLAETLVRSGADLLSAIEGGFAEGIRRVGALWDAGEYFLPELVQGAEAMKAAMEILSPALARGIQVRGSPGQIVLGTVRGDLHDIGKGLVGTLLAAHGFVVHDLGSDVPVEAFVEKTRETGARVVGASALLTTTMTVQREIARAVGAAALPWNPRVLVGGAPTSEAWAAEIGAAHAENALRAVEVVERLLA